MTQPEALRLADALDCVTDDNCGYCMPCSVAAELRLLHAELVESEKWRDRDEARAANAERERDIAEAQRDALLEACRMAMMLRHLGGMLPGSREIVEEIVKAASAAIAKAEGEKV